MDVAQRRFRRILLQLVTAPLLLLAFLGGVVIWQIVELNRLVTETDQLTATLRTARDAHLMITELDLDVRRYQLTGDAALLAHYQQADPALAKQLDMLEAFALRDPVRPDPVRLLRAQREDLARHNREIIELRELGREVPRATLLAGDALLGEVGRTFTTIIGEREGRRNGRAAQAIASTKRVTWTAAVLSLVFGGALSLFVRRQVLLTVAEYGRAFNEARRRAAEQMKHQEELVAMAESLERRVVERTKLLEEANRELEAFSYSISHDLRAPLRSMQGFAGLLLEECGPALGTECSDFANRILKSATYMQTLMDDLLRYSRLGRAEIAMGPVPLERAVDEAIGQLTTDVADKKADITVARPLPDVAGNRPIVVQVVANLAANALKFVDGKRPEVRIHAEARGGRVRLWVEDNGIGIAPEHQERIFRVFERLHGVEAYPGTGVGLAIAKRGMERMGGEIGVESEIGKGSRFWIELPGA
jgi:signal transduction histidine kinase